MKPEILKHQTYKQKFTAIDIATSISIFAKQIKEFAYLLDAAGNRQSAMDRRIQDLENAKKGITLRQWFAGQALIMGALCCVKPEERIECAFRTADKMIAFEMITAEGDPEKEKA